MEPQKVRYRTEELELKKAAPSVGIRSELEAAGLVFLGSLTMAAKGGYYSPRACEKMGQPVMEWEQPTHCAVMADCPTDLCMRDTEGNLVRPCLPVYFRRSE